MATTSPQPSEPLPFDLDELMAWAMEEDDGAEGGEKYRAPIINIFADALRVDGPYGSDRETVCNRAAKAIADLQLVASHIPEESRSDPEAISLAKEESETFLWELWTMMLNVSCRVPHNLDHPGQVTLMGILETLDGRTRCARTGVYEDDEDEDKEDEDDEEEDDEDEDEEGKYGEEDKGEDEGDEEEDEHDDDEDEEDEEDGHKDKDKPFWEGLPMFGVLSEFTAGLHFLDKEEAKQIKGDKDANVEKTIARWQNKMAFFARCYAAELGNAVSDDCAVYNLCEALEGGDPNVKWKDGTLWKGGPVLTVNDRSRLVAATAWIIHAGDELYRHSRHNSYHSSEGCDRVLEFKPRPAGRYFLAKHPGARHGMSLMRWNYWKDRLKSLLNPPPLRSRGMAVAEDVLAAVTAAINKMEQIEQDERDEKERRAAMLIKLMEDLGLKKSGRAMNENWSAARIEKEKKKRELRKAASQQEKKSS